MQALGARGRTGHRPEEQKKEEKASPIPEEDAPKNISPIPVFKPSTSFGFQLGADSLGRFARRNSASDKMTGLTIFLELEILWRFGACGVAVRVRGNSTIHQPPYLTLSGITRGETTLLEIAVGGDGRRRIGA